MKDHYVLDTCWDNLGNGWRMHCQCGWCTIPAECLMNAGEEFDDHLKDEDAAPKPKKRGRGGMRNIVRSQVRRAMSAKRGGAA